MVSHACRLEVAAISPEIYPTKRSAPPRIRELDGLRGVGALAVFFHHVLFTSVSHVEQQGWFSRVAVAVSKAGGYGVDHFFVQDVLDSPPGTKVRARQSAPDDCL